jgi:predicted DNA-binding helix-hairpin-helix protein
MELHERLELLSDAARFDLCNTFARGKRRYQPAAPPADDAGRRARPVFRALMNSNCVWNCAYCPLRAANDVPRARLDPEELVQAFLPRYQAADVQGLFLSNAVDRNPDHAAAQLIDAVDLLRRHHAYTGYVHLKLSPGVSAAVVEQAARLADRVSLNLEAPGPEYLARISPERNWQQDLLQPLLQLREWQQAGSQRAGLRLGSGLATQFVVGASGENDAELLMTSRWLYRDLGLRRVYFGAFRAMPATPLATAASTPLLRVQRLQQADWLLREYGFHDRELPFEDDRNLPLHIDPKLAWALAHPECFPVEVNQAGPEALLRVPGFGPLAVRRILRLRRIAAFREPEHLRALGNQAARALDFVTLAGRAFGLDAAGRARRYARRNEPIVEQLRLW